MEDNQQQYQPNPAPAAQYEVPAAPKSFGEKLKNCFAPQNRKKTLIVLAALVLLIVVVACAAKHNSPASVAERFTNACFGNTKAQYKLLAYDKQKLDLYYYDGDEEEYFMSMSDSYDEDIDSWNDYYKVCDEEMKNDLEDEVGYDCEVTVKVTKEKNISVDNYLDDDEYWLDWLEEAAEFDRDRISAVKEVTVKVRLKGEDDIQRETLRLMLVKAGGGWKVINVSYD